jgi:hypothetical protein
LNSLWITPVPADIVWIRIGAKHVLNSHAVLVGQAAIHNVGEDLHITMSMRSKTPARRHPIVVEDAQRPEPIWEGSRKPGNEDVWYVLSQPWPK